MADAGPDAAVGGGRLPVGRRRGRGRRRIRPVRRRRQVDGGRRPRGRQPMPRGSAGLSRRSRSSTRRRAATAMAIDRWGRLTDFLGGRSNYRLARIPAPDVLRLPCGRRSGRPRPGPCGGPGPRRRGAGRAPRRPRRVMVALGSSARAGRCMRSGSGSRASPFNVGDRRSPSSLAVMIPTGCYCSGHAT